MTPKELATLLKRAGSKTADEKKIRSLCDAAGIKLKSNGRVDLLLFFAALQKLNN